MQRSGPEVLGREMSVPEDRNRGDHGVLGPGLTGLRQARAYRPRPELVLRRGCRFTFIKWALCM